MKEIDNNGLITMNKFLIFTTSFLVTYLLLRYKNRFEREDQINVNLDSMFNAYDHSHLNHIND